MRVLLTSAGLETEEIKECFLDMAGKDMSLVKALFIPTAAIDADAIEVLPKCMNDLLKCGILDKNIVVYDLHAKIEFENLQQYDVVYLCGGVICLNPPSTPHTVQIRQPRMNSTIAVIRQPFVKFFMPAHLLYERFSGID